MSVESVPDAASFLAVTEALRSRQPILTNVLGSVAEGAAAGRRYDSELWLVVRERGEPVGCAMHTAPFKVALSPMSIPAAQAMGTWLRENAPEVPGLSGPEDVVSAVADGMGRVAEIQMRELARRLTHLAPPKHDRTPGRGVLAERSELDLLVDWLVAFEVEAGMQRFANPEHTGAQVDSGRLWVWRVDDQPVALAGHAPVVATAGMTIGRIGPVYTPPAYRRHGYGAAVTRAVALELIAQCDELMLFADAANRDSNGVYESMGFAVVAEIVEADLGA